MEIEHYFYKWAELGLELAMYLSATDGNLYNTVKLHSNVVSMGLTSFASWGVRARLTLKR